MRLYGTSTFATVVGLGNFANGVRVQQAGSVNDVPTIWLENPVGNTKVVRCFRVYGWGNTPLLRIWRPLQSAPFIPAAGAGGTVTDGRVRWTDGRTAGAPTAFVRGVDFSDPTTQAFSTALPRHDLNRSENANSTNIPYVRLVTDEHWRIPAGSCLAVQGGAGGVGSLITAVFYFEEEG